MTPTICTIRARHPDDEIVVVRETDLYIVSEIPRQRLPSFEYLYTAFFDEPAHPR